MKQILNFALILSFLLTACSSTTATPLVPTLTPIPLEPTLAETATAVPSETPTQTPVPLLEDLPLTKESINQFANALNATGVATTPELIIQQGLTIKEIIGVDGKKYEIASTQDGYPLMIKGEKGNEWSEVTPGKLGELKGIVVGGMIEKYPDTEKIYRSLNGGEIVGNWGYRQVKIGGNIDLSYENFQLNYAGQFPFGKDRKHMLYDSLIWPAFMPEGFDKLTRSEAITAMETYIEKMITTYADKIGNYVIVNEPRTNDICARIIGKDYIEIAFKKARAVAKKVNPDTMLIYNQTDNHDSSGKFVKDTEVTGNDLWKKGLIDAIGVQGHLAYGSATSYPSEEDMYKTLIKYEAPIILTELDVNLIKISDSQKNTIGAKWYKNLIKACLRTGRCKAIYVYGAFPDINSWYVRVEGQPNADSTLWSNDSKPKKAYYELMKALIEIP